MMIHRSSRTTSLLGSSLNSSQLSLYSHASSRSGAGNSSRHDSLGRTAELARVSSGGQASKAVSGHGYLTSSRTVSAPKGTQLKSKGAISEARERRKQERRRAHTAADEESLDGDTGVKNDDLESYLMSFGGKKAGPVGPKATAEGKSGARKSVLPRGSELDWDKLLESGELMNETQSEDDNVFSDNIEDPGGFDGSAFLKRPDPTPGPLGEQTRDKLRRISNVSSDIKFLGENSLSPSVSDLVLTDSLDTSSTVHTPMATERPRQAHTMNLLSDSDHSLERNALNDVKEAADLISNNEINADAALSPDRSKPVTTINGGPGACSSPPIASDRVSISEDQSISESFDFKQNVLSSIDQLEADINELHHQSSDESSFKRNLHDVHSLQELEELLEDPPPRHNEKDITNLSTSHGKGVNNLTTKSIMSTKREQSPAQPKPRPSSFKFSATSTVTENIPDKQHKEVMSYSSDEFESESVSEVESIVVETNGSVKEESVIAHSSDGELEETVASGDSGDDDRTEERHGDVDIMEHSELSYSSFSEVEQIDKSGRGLLCVCTCTCIPTTCCRYACTVFAKMQGSKRMCVGLVLYVQVYSWSVLRPNT